ncbi:MFS general substrate transporter, partial [Colletotrichum zoysiae]
DGPESPDDMVNPQDWSIKKKWTTIIVVSAITFNQAMSSTIFAPGVSQAMRDLHVSSSAGATLSISIYVIGLAVGPLFLSPLSERYGRMPIMHGTNVLFLAASVVCAVSVNLPMLLVFRFLAGTANVSLGGGYVADVMPPELRQRAMNVWTIGPVLAPIVGPIAGGYISMNTTWRWTFGILSITGALAVLSTLLFLEETYLPRLQELKARRRRGPAATEAGLPANEKKSYQKSSMAKPFQLLLTSPALVVVSLFLAVAYSYMYLMFTTFNSIFADTYGFTAGQVGLSYLGLGIGCLLGQYSVDLFMRRHLTAKHATDDSGPQPERNLPILIVAGVLLAVGLFWYGWALEYRTHWIVPILGTAVCGFSISLFFLGVQTYIVEVYTLYAASALAASTAIRCVFGLTIPLAAPPLYRRLGLGWGNSLLGFLALATVPASLWLWRSSKRLRKA